MFESIIPENKKAMYAAVGDFFKARRGWFLMQGETICCTGDNCNTEVPSLPPAGNKIIGALLAMKQNTFDYTSLSVLDKPWNNLLLYKDTYYIKRMAPSLNKGRKCSREFCFVSSLLLAPYLRATL